MRGLSYQGHSFVDMLLFKFLLFYRVRVWREGDKIGERVGGTSNLTGEVKPKGSRDQEKRS